MKSHWTKLLACFETFFRFLGGLICLFLLLPPLTRSGGPLHLAPFEILLCLGAALVFALTHWFLLAEGLDGRLSIRARCLLCALPCALALGALAYYSGLGFVALNLRHIPDVQAATAVLAVNFLLAFALFVLGYVLLQRHHLRLGRQYTAALAAYREKHRGEQLPGPEA